MALDRTTRLRPRYLACLVGGHLAMLALMFVLLETYEPEPNGFRFDTAAKVGSFAVLTMAPVAIGLGVRSLLGAASIGLLQALSPLALLGNMQDPNSDLNFALLLWWFPLPGIALLILIIDHIVGGVRATKREPHELPWPSGPMG